MGTCRGFGCTSTDLIDAHIIPAGFARLVRGPDHTIKVTMRSAGRAKQQLGEFDRTILCSACDNKLGVYDNYALGALSSFSRKHTMTPQGIAELAVDGDKIAKFVLAVLWRASISSREAFSAVRLGPYEDMARDVLFDVRLLSGFRQFSVFFDRYRSKKIDVENFYLSIGRIRVEGLNAYMFSLAGFRITAVLDARNLPSGLSALAVNGSSTLRTPMVELETTTEFGTMKRMIDGSA